jgi:xylan 1,4-beta-xylosidase
MVLMTLRSGGVLPNVLVTIALVLQTLATSLHGQSANDQPIVIDAGGRTSAFPHIWEQMFGSGRAILSLRDSYREDLRHVKGITGFGYIRFHGILNDEVGVYDRDSQGKASYNFSYVDQIYDGLLANHVRPFVEISFMPKLLAANPTPHAFWYKPYPSPPKDPVEWEQLISAFTQHLIARYGAAEVEKWYFEVWNEPNIDFWNGEPKKDTYFSLYKLTANAIKKVDPRLKVGGPSTAQAAWADDFIEYCSRSGVPFDFVSTHIYGNENPVDVFGKPMPILRKHMVALAIRKVHDQVAKSAAPKTPILVTEYNATYLTQQEVTDSAFMGPWLANNISECDGLTSMMSYWSFSDVFEEQGVVKTPFYGGYGIVAERGIPKAAYRAFELLHQLGDQRMANESPDALVTKRGDGAIVLALWNYAEPNEKAGQKVFRVKVTNGGAKKYTIQIVDPAHGSALAAWNTMGKPITPTLPQIAKLIDASTLAPPAEHALSEPIHLNPQGLALVTINQP